MSSKLRWTVLAILLGAGLLAGCATPDESGDDGADTNDTDTNGTDGFGTGNNTNDTGFDSVMDNDWDEMDEAGNATTTG